MNKHIFWISSYPKSGNTLVRAIITGLFFSNDGKVTFEDMRHIGLFETARRLNFIKSINKKDFYNYNIPKVVTNERSELLYMSRAPIPINKKGKHINSFKQVCIYSFPKNKLFVVTL